MAATALTLGSGGSGGVFAPSLFLGAKLGAAWGRGDGLLLPGMIGKPSAYAIVGMADRSVPVVLPSDSLDVVMHLFGRTHRDELPVVADPEHREVVGMVTLTSVIDAYNRSLFSADLTGGFGAIMRAVQGGRPVEVLAGIHLAEVELPSALVGKTLAAVNLRRAHGLEVVLIHTAAVDDKCLEGRPGKLPSPDAILERGDRLLVMGAVAAIEAFKEA